MSILTMLPEILRCAYWERADLSTASVLVEAS
jgi:hypothetical protein